MNIRKSLGSITLLMVSLCLLSSIAATAQSHTIYLTGSVDSFYKITYQTNELVLRKVVTANMQGKEELLKIPLDKKGRFKTTINVTDSINYFAFAFEDKSPGNKKGRLFNTFGGASATLLKEVYLFQPGDSVSIFINPEVRPYFWGKGNEKLNCASQFYEIEAIPQGLSSRMNSLADKTEFLQFRQKALDYSIQMRLTIMDSYKNILPDFIYQLLKADAVHSAIYTAYTPIINNPNFRLATEYYSHSAISEMYERSQRYLGNNTTILARSAYGADFTFRNDMIKRLLVQPAGSDKALFAKTTYEYFNKEYSAELREKILLIFFETLGRHFSTEVKPFAIETLSSMQSKQYARALTQWKDAQYYAYPFRLYDSKQQLHKLEDYKGKLVVIDFYFSKCGPCIQLAQTMKPIVQQFINRKDIVFVTVSTDPKDVFLKTLAKKIFTNEHTVNLYTNGNGMSDPLIRHYDFMGFPKMLLIDKTGALITSSPPRPDLGEANLAAFMKLINENL